MRIPKKAKGSKVQLGSTLKPKLLPVDEPDPAKRRRPPEDSTRGALPESRPKRPRTKRDQNCVLLDLDQTLLHMMPKDFMPTSASQLSDAVVPLSLSGRVEDRRQMIAARVGAGALIAALRQRDVDVRIVTLNLEGRDVVRAISLSDAPHAAAWKDLDVTVVSGPERTTNGGLNSKSLPVGVEADVANGRLCILDDNKEVWRRDLQRFVVKAAPFFVDREIPGQSGIVKEREYLTRIKEDFIKAIRERGRVWPLTYPGFNRSRSNSPHPQTTGFSAPGPAAPTGFSPP